MIDGDHHVRDCWCVAGPLSFPLVMRCIHMPSARFLILWSLRPARIEDDSSSSTRSPKPLSLDPTHIAANQVGSHLDSADVHGIHVETESQLHLQDRAWLVTNRVKSVLRASGDPPGCTWRWLPSHATHGAPHRLHRSAQERSTSPNTTSPHVHAGSFCLE